MHDRSIYIPHFQKGNYSIHLGNDLQYDYPCTKPNPNPTLSAYLFANRSTNLMCYKIMAWQEAFKLSIYTKIQLFYITISLVKESN